MKPLAYALALFKANLTFVSPFGLEFEKGIINELKEKFNSKITQTNYIYGGIRKADVLYVCRIQKERFTDKYEAEKLQKAFKITPEMIEQAKDNMVILHALPKITEIDHVIDKTKHAKYFEQVAFGVPVRMAILNLVI